MNRKSAMTEMMIVSMLLLKVIAEAHIESANDKKQNNDPSENQVIHSPSCWLTVTLAHSTGTNRSLPLFGRLVRLLTKGLSPDRSEATMLLGYELTKSAADEDQPDDDSDKDESAHTTDSIVDGFSHPR